MLPESCNEECALSETRATQPRPTPIHSGPSRLLAVGRRGRLPLTSRRQTGPACFPEELLQCPQVQYGSRVASPDYQAGPGIRYCRPPESAPDPPSCKDAPLDFYQRDPE